MELGAQAYGRSLVGSLSGCFLLFPSRRRCYSPGVAIDTEPYRPFEWTTPKGYGWTNRMTCDCPQCVRLRAHMTAAGRPLPQYLYRSDRDCDRDFLLWDELEEAEDLYG